MRVIDRLTAAAIGTSGSRHVPAGLPVALALLVGLLVIGGASSVYIAAEGDAHFAVGVVPAQLGFWMLVGCAGLRSRSAGN